jgi:hypothetical protein
MLLLLCVIECRTLLDDIPSETPTLLTVDFDLGLGFFLFVLLGDTLEPAKEGRE